jgi:hypothetical protein
VVWAKRQQSTCQGLEQPLYWAQEELTELKSWQRKSMTNGGKALAVTVDVTQRDVTGKGPCR